MVAQRYEIYLRELKYFSTGESKINFVSPSDHIIFFLLYKMGRFSELISDHSPKISEEFLKLVRRQDECF